MLLYLAMCLFSRQGTVDGSPSSMHDSQHHANGFVNGTSVAVAPQEQYTSSAVDQTSVATTTPAPSSGFQSGAAPLSMLEEFANAALSADPTPEEKLAAAALVAVQKEGRASQVARASPVSQKKARKRKKTDKESKSNSGEASKRSQESRVPGKKSTGSRSAPKQLKSTAPTCTGGGSANNTESQKKSSASSDSSSVMSTPHATRSHASCGAATPVATSPVHSPVAAAPGEGVSTQRTKANGREAKQQDSHEKPKRPASHPFFWPVPMMGWPSMISWPPSMMPGKAAAGGFPDLSQMNWPLQQMQQMQQLQQQQQQQTLQKLLFQQQHYLRQLQQQQQHPTRPAQLPLLTGQTLQRESSRASTPLSSGIPSPRPDHQPQNTQNLLGQVTQSAGSQSSSSSSSMQLPCATAGGAAAWPAANLVNAMNEAGQMHASKSPAPSRSGSPVATAAPTPARQNQVCLIALYCWSLEWSYPILQD